MTASDAPPFVAASALPEHPNLYTAVTNTRYPTDGVLHQSQSLHEIVNGKSIHRDFAMGPRGLDSSGKITPNTGGSQLGDNRVWQGDCSTS